MSAALKAPFPWFGGKRKIAAEIWDRFGNPKQYIEPFFGSGAVLLAAPQTASLEVVGDMNGFLANFWRAVSHQPDEVARWAHYPVSHIDQGARHVWLMQQRERLGEMLQDPHWPGDAQIAGWWVWGQCSWIGSGWCDWFGKVPHVGNAGMGVQAAGQIPHVGNAGMGVQAAGQVPHVSNAGRGVQAAGQVPHVSDAGRGVQAAGQVPHVSNAGVGVQAWMRELSERLHRVRIIHGDWSRCLNHHYGGNSTAVLLDPPYRAFESLYGCEGVADEVEAWARDHAHLRVALCGHLGDYDLPDWELLQWSRPAATYGSDKTKDAEAIWFSPSCLGAKQGGLF